MKRYGQILLVFLANTFLGLGVRVVADSSCLNNCLQCNSDPTLCDIFPDILDSNRNLNCLGFSPGRYCNETYNGF